MSVPRRILHVIDSLDLGGAQTFLLGLCKHLDANRFECEVACMHGRGVYAEAFERAGIPVHSLSPGKFPPLYLPNFWRLMRTGGYDILHFHLFGSNLCAKPLAVMAGHPAIVVHDQCNDASRERNLLLLAADAFWNQRSDRVIAVSGSTRRYLLDREDLTDDQVTLIPNGIDTEEFHPPSNDAREDARKRLRIPLDAFVIGGVGRLVLQKNFDLFLEVAAGILASRSEVLFLIAGTGPLEVDLKAKADRLGIADKVRFLGHVEDRVGLYHALDVLLMTSDFEGTPMVLLEAMACGLPIVASAVDGIAEVCTRGHDAFLGAPGDPGEFSKGLSFLIEHPEVMDALALNARQTVIQGYDIRRLARCVEDVYDSLLSKGDALKRVECS
jgi:glycosyltransferase involved in cell wall biosynthesis